MRQKQVNFTQGTVDIHPYVQARLRLLPRQDETAGILLGSSEDGFTRVTGFKRVTPSALRQAASDAGPALAGFYRLQTASAPTLLPEEEELWRDAQPFGRSLFLLVKAVDGGVEGTAWTREESGPPVAESISLGGDRSEPPISAEPHRTAIRIKRPAVLWYILAIAAVGLAAAVGVNRFNIVKADPLPAVSLDLDLKSGNGELTAAWEQHGSPAKPLQSATLTILDGASEQIRDLTRNYTSRGRITVRPQFRDIVVTLKVQYAGAPPMSSAATYIGFVPPPPPEPEPAPALEPDPENEELIALRKRNKELEEAVAALRKHMRPTKAGPGKGPVARKTQRR